MKKRLPTPALSPADIERLNALRIRRVAEDDDNPPLTTAQLAQVVRHRGRPRGSRKASVTVRLDTDVVVWLKSEGAAIKPASIASCGEQWSGAQ